MPARNSRGRFVKRSRSHAIARRSHRSYSPARRHRRRSGHAGGGLSPIKIGLAAAALAYGTKNIGGIGALAARVPGAKTFGAPAALGLAAFAVDKWIHHNRWLKLAGMAGIVLAAATIGTQGSDFQWVGDVGDDVDLGEDDIDEDDQFDAAND